MMTMMMMTNLPRQPLLPASQGETTLGVLGGGQLGRMFVHAAQQMGYFTAVLDPDPTSPAGRVSHHHIQTDYLDPQGLAELSRLCSAVTTEFENVPAQALATLAEQLPVAPAASAVSIAQDRAREKAHFVRCGVPCAPYAVIETEAQLAALDDAALLPGILKTARMGYDGKGQVRVKTRAELAAAWQGLKQVPCVLGHRGTRCGGPAGAFSGAAQPAPRRHPGRHRGVRGQCERRRGRTGRGGRPFGGPGPRLRGRAVRRVLRAAGRLAGGQ